MDEWAEGKKRLTDLVRAINPEVSVVIPTKPSSGTFLIALARGKGKKFITISEDDLLDLVDDHAIETEVLQTVTDALNDASPAA